MWRRHWARPKRRPPTRVRRMRRIYEIVFGKPRARFAPCASGARWASLSEEELRAALRQWMILDRENVWWMLGVESERWYRYVDMRWQLTEPPLALSDEEGEAPERGDTGAGLALTLEEAESAPALAIDESPLSLTRGLLAEAAGFGAEVADDVPNYEIPPPGPLYRQAWARQQARRRRRIGLGLVFALGGSFLAGVATLARGALHLQPHHRRISRGN